MHNKKKLKFGIICDSHSLADWQIETINQLIRSEKADLSLIILAENDQIDKNKSSFLRKMMGKFFSKNLFFSLWQKFLKREIRQNLNKIHKFSSDEIIFNCTTKKKGKYRDYFSDENLKEIENYQLDFILRFGLGILIGKILTIPKYGVWSFHHGDERKYRGRPACFWEMFNNEHKIGGILQRLTEKLDGGIILKRWFIQNNKLSWYENLKNLRQNGTGLPKQVCFDILNENSDYIFDTPSKTKAEIKYLPTNLEMLFFFYVTTKNRLFSFFKKFCVENWRIGIIEKDINKYIFNLNNDKIHWIESKDQNKFFADPFPLMINNKLNILFETFNHKSGIGHISKFIFDEENNVFESKEVLKDGDHYSYPFIYTDSDNIYLIPEQMSKNDVSIYQIDPKSGDIINKKNILSNIKLSDPTIFYHNSKFWLFGTVEEIKLMAWYADTIDGPWFEHLNNPIKIDVSSSRNGGSVFYDNNNLIRLAQDCSKEYGSRIAVNQISELTEKTFYEKTIKYIEPQKNWKFNEGLHTISHTKKYVIIDAKRTVFLLQIMIRKIVRKLGI